MDVGTDYQPSYAWRSILNARSLITLGGTRTWIIGNGATARIWKDKWIGDNSFIKSRKPINTMNEDACVSELIDLDLRHGNRDKIFQFFYHSEATEILITHVSLRL